MTADEGVKVRQFLQSIHAVSNTSECATIYDEWAKTYDLDVQDAGVDYVGPMMTAQVIVDSGGKLEGSILDAGCGTGLVGVFLAKAGATSIDGIDISPGMMQVARRTGAYRHLSVADMSAPIDKADGAYDVISCCGTLTHGHVGPVPVLQEFVRIAKKDGLIVATVVDEVWVSGGYQAEVQRLKASACVRVLGTDIMDYRRGTDMKARMVVLKKI